LSSVAILIFVLAIFKATMYTNTQFPFYAESVTSFHHLHD